SPGTDLRRKSRKAASGRRPSGNDHTLPDSERRCGPWAGRGTRDGGVVLPTEGQPGGWLYTPAVDSRISCHRVLQVSETRRRESEQARKRSIGEPRLVRRRH